MKLPIAGIDVDLSRVLEAEPVVLPTSNLLGLRLTFDQGPPFEVFDPLDVAMVAGAFCARFNAVRKVVLSRPWA